MTDQVSKTAFVFPGQGSQSVGMLSDLAENFSIVSETFDEASEALSYDLWSVCQHDEEKLSQTEVTQPALLAASIACLRVLQAETDLSADYLAGHSLGEYTALVAADSLSLSAGVKLVQARGQFMQKAVAPNDGAMYAILGLDDEVIIQTCTDVAAKTNSVVSAVNFNSPGQVVIAGSKAATEEAANLLKEAGAKRALPLSVSVPSHCMLMKPASEKLASLLSAINLKSPSIDIINNVDVSIEDNSDAIKDALVRQLYLPVRWTETIELMSAKHVDNIIEVGPGKVLLGLIKRINKSISTRSVNSAKDFQ